MIKEFNEFNKLNEYFNPDYKYENIIIIVNNIEEFYEIKKYLKIRLFPVLNTEEQDNCDDELDTIEYLINRFHDPQYIHIKDEQLFFNFYHGDLRFYNRHGREYHHEKLFTINDVRCDFLSNIIKYGISSLPSYNPRKIDKNI